ncbi:MAG: L-rhamnose isomerase [Bacteroidales bacterium]|nr:L-rhamnose isomerase [Bacteroidales bacterium]
MKQTKTIHEAYAIAKERYAALGIDTEQAIGKLQDIHLSLHCWQADDVQGFESAGDLSGGIQATGNYPGKARNVEELRSDIIKAKSLIPGTHRLNLHEIYGEFGGKKVDRNEVEPKHFEGWMQWAAENGMKLDFNSTSFSHPLSGNLTLANPDEAIRKFWIEHTQRCRAIADEMGRRQGDPCIMNIWIHDGAKDFTVNRLKYRQIYNDSLNEIFSVRREYMKDCLEPKLFGIGLESFTVGSSDFYWAYCSKHNVIPTLDTGHYHPTENVYDKVSSLLIFCPELMLHVSRPVRWDSDHVTLMDDATVELMKEIVYADATDRVHIGLDYFDGAINRIGAYLIGARSTQKSMLQALLSPVRAIRKYEEEDKGFQKLTLLEMAKTLPWNAVWEEFCVRNDVPVGEDCIAEVEAYEKEVLSKR